MNIRQAFQIIDRVCANFVANRETHKTIEQALSVISNFIIKHQTIDKVQFQGNCTEVKLPKEVLPKEQDKATVREKAE